MGIISALLAFQIASSVVLPAIAITNENEKSNETKININEQENIEKINLLIDSKSKKPLNLESSEGFLVLEKKQEKNPEDLKREEALERFAEKRKSAVLPKGTFIVNASAYTAAADECGKSDGITASGLMVKENETIACPPQFPFGIKIKIEGMGTYICQDRGGAIKGNKFDIYMKTKKEAFAFGRRNLEAEVIM